jgi:hypothetical protein
MTFSSPLQISKKKKHCKIEMILRSVTFCHKIIVNTHLYAVPETFLEYIIVARIEDINEKFDHTVPWTGIEG